MPLTPSQGSSAGGTAVVITGTNLGDATAVRFGTKLGTITANTETQVDVLSPAGHSVADVTVVTPGGSSNPLPFYYVEPPQKFTLLPTTGSSAGGDSVTLQGINLNDVTDVSFGGTPGTITSSAPGTVTVTTPAGTAGTVPLTVTTPGGTTNGLFFTYVDAPTVTAIDPDEGSETGGTQVLITGTDLTSTSEVTFAGTPASFGVLSDTSVSAVTPSGIAGTADVVVTTAGGSSTLLAGFTYLAGPGV